MMIVIMIVILALTKDSIWMQIDGNDYNDEHENGDL